MGMRHVPPTLQQRTSQGHSPGCEGRFGQLALSKATRSFSRSAVLTSACLAMSRYRLAATAGSGPNSAMLYSAARIASAPGQTRPDLVACPSLLALRLPLQSLSSFPHSTYLQCSAFGSNLASFGSQRSCYGIVNCCCQRAPKR